MPIESPILDDLRYEQLRELLIRQIPIHAPEWTNHNASDPGIALIELFSVLAEQLGYRLDRVPDKNYVEFLKLLGIRLQPATAASTRVAMILDRPETKVGTPIPAGTKIEANVGAPPPKFETDVALDLVPAQLAALVTTVASDLRELAPDEDPPSDLGEQAEFIEQRYTLAWDGKTPKLQDMPSTPVSLLVHEIEGAQRYVWIGLAFNPTRPAGFIGQRVTMTVQFDDDEQPDALARFECGEQLDGELESRELTWLYYRPRQPSESRGTLRELRILSDSTGGLLRSGQLRFDVPVDLGPIPNDEWTPLRAPVTRSRVDICQALADEGDAPLPEPIDHPLIGALPVPVTDTPTHVPISGWLSVALPSDRAGMRLRAISFNVVAATHATTVRDELVGRGDGLPGQRLRLAHGNVLAGSLDLLVEEPISQMLEPWTEVEDFDAAGPRDKVYMLDREAGELLFGGVRGRVPGQVPLAGANPNERMRIVARRYRHGGGLEGELPAGTLVLPPATVAAVTNIVAARGGRPSESLEQAKLRAPRELKVRDRAVTAEDFEFIARATEEVRVARAPIVPLRRPYGGERPGVDFDIRAPGAVSVIAVPDELGPHPTPTAGFLRAVCRKLDRHRLITTEVHVVAPQYVRLFAVSVRVRALPGWSLTLLREAIAAQLERRFHVLTGGPASAGVEFGATVHHADLVAEVFAVEGVARVEALEAQFDGNAPAEDGEPPPLSWRWERSVARRLTNCPSQASDVDRIELFDDENVFVDTRDLLVSIT